MVRYKLWVNGRWVESSQKAILLSPFDDEKIAEVDQASLGQMQEAIATALEGFKAFSKTSRFLRSALLQEMALLVAERRADFIKTISAEAGKPVTLADGEVTRCVATLTIASEEAKRYGGEVVPIDVEAASRGYAPAISFWVPRGPVLGITPFNFPLNLVAHKVAPALAAGASIIVKPAPQAPGAAVLLAQVFEQAIMRVRGGSESVPPGVFQVLSAPNEIVASAISDPRLSTVSFTGSAEVGWLVQKMAVGKRALLELGGNAAVIVHGDADLARAARRCAAGAFGFAGQSCISVQRVFVEKRVRDAFAELLSSEAVKIVSGDPARSDVLNGPMINARAADRIMLWIDEALQSGARLLTGGGRRGNVVEPTILVDVDPSAKIVREEAFAPVLSLSSYDEFSGAIESVNDSRFGLQAGVFTDSAKLIHEAVVGLEVGGVMVNEAPTYRAEQMPYGGVKESGLGREGLRYAIEEYSERRTVVQWVG